MKSFQHLTTVIALMLLASHQAVAAPTPDNQARSDSQSVEFPKNYDSVVTSIGPHGDKISIVTGPSKAVVIVNGKVEKLNSADSQRLAAKITNKVDKAVSQGITHGENLASHIIHNVDKQIAHSFAASGL